MRVRVPRWSIPVWILLAEFGLLSIFPLSASYAVTKSNPIGILTNYLIFDDPGNLFTLVWSVLTFLLAMLFVGSHWRKHLAWTYFVATNFAGIFGGFVYFESPYAYQTGGGMSGATFGALAMALGMTAVVLANSYSTYREEMYRGNFRFWALLVLAIFGVYLESTALTGFVAKPASQLIHASGILVGFLVGLVSPSLVILRSQEKDYPSAASGQKSLPLQAASPPVEVPREKYLIILRGPPTSGKSVVVGALEQVLGATDCFHLHLDTVEQDLPPDTYSNSMQKRFILAEIYSGREHLYTPLMWMQRYKDEGRKILSVCLDLDFRTGIERQRQRMANGRDVSGQESGWIVLFFRFYTDPDMTNFAERAGIPEVRVDTRGKDPRTIGEEILGSLGIRQGNCS